MNRRKFLKLTASTVTGSLSGVATDAFATRHTREHHHHHHPSHRGTTWNLTPAQAADITQVQAVANGAANGDTIVIPNGTYTWASALFINGGKNPDGSGIGKSVNVYGETKGQVTINVNGTAVVSCASAPGYNVEIKNLTCREGPALSGGHTGHYFLWCQRIGDTWGTGFIQNGGVFLVHDCDFASAGNIDAQVRWMEPGGVMWNNHFGVTGTGGYYDDAIQLQNSSDDYWATESTMGTLDTTGLNNTYIEDNTFNQVGGNIYAVDCNDGSKTVLRYNQFIDTGCGNHGPDSCPYGLRHCEIYNNTFTHPTPSVRTYVWVFDRGAVCACYNNNFGALSGSNQIAYLMELETLRRGGTPFCCVATSYPASYPAPRQQGWGWHAGAQVLDPTYIWNNTGAANSSTVLIQDYSPDQCGNNQLTANYVQQNREYYIGSAKPGYTTPTGSHPAAYPHPLIATVSGPPPSVRPVVTGINPTSGATAGGTTRTDKKPAKGVRE